MTNWSPLAEDGNILAVCKNANKGGVSLFKKRYPSLKPSQRKFYIASEQLEELQCLPIALPSRGVAALALLYDLPLLLSSAAALPIL